MTGEGPKPSVSCIVPAYNEAGRIGHVLAAVVGHPLVDEVIVVDDASGDATADVARNMDGVRLIVHTKNKGKTRALESGLKAATGDFLLLLDADLTGLQADHITALITPVLGGQADISISLRQNAPRLWRMIGLDYISGERVFHKDLLKAHLETLPSLPKFGFEVFLNSLCIKQKYRIAVVCWPGVESPFKNRKYGFWPGLLADIRMLRDIFKTVSLWAILRQIILMRRLRIHPKTPQT